MQVMQEAQGRATGLLSAEEVGRRLGIDTSTVYRMAGDGRLRAIKVGRQWRFPLDDLPVWVSDSAIDSDVANAVAEVSSHLLGVMVMVCDLEGAPLTAVHNPCDRFRLADSEDAASCLAEWREFARARDLTPRFHRGSLGFDCAAAFIRSGDRLAGLVIAGGIAPVDEPAPDVHVLTRAQRSLVLESLPRVAAAVVERRTP